MMQRLTLLIVLFFGSCALAHVCRRGGIRLECCSECNTQETCIEKGCCWDVMVSSKGALSTPSCYKANAPTRGYQITDISESASGITANLTLIEPSKLSFGSDIQSLSLIVSFETESRLRVKVFDPNSKRWEPPSYEKQQQVPSTTNKKYGITLNHSPFGFVVYRKDDNTVIFNTTDVGLFNGLIFQDKYIEISTKMSETSHIYGLGERVSTFKLNRNNTIYSFWAADNPGLPRDVNLYGSHPFYLEHNIGKSHGVFLHNSNGIDVYMGDNYLTYRIIGGVIDLYFFVGPSPTDVVQQYTELIGRPFLPPYWSLGFHQSRWGYKTLDNIKTVVNEYKKASIPLDTIWSDIDYMENYKVFTWNPTNYPATEVKTFIDDLHSNGQHYIVIVDPGVKIGEPQGTYTPYEDGNQMNVWIKASNGNATVNTVWPGETVFPDFLHPSIKQYWKKQMSEFLTKVPLDGIWLDMNEIGSFCNGTCPDYVPPTITYPYKLVNVRIPELPLERGTLAIDAYHAGGELEYDVHNLYGHSEAKVTASVLQEITNKRQMIITRSSFPGTGAFSGKWLGDNLSEWSHLKDSIAGILSFQLFGIPLIGADICGFGDIGKDVNMIELCTRWIQVGSFYPFSRNHFIIDKAPQELYTWESVANVSRKVLNLRYSLLPYLYTEFYHANHEGTPVLYPLFFDSPLDVNAIGKDEQFFFGKSILVTPVLTQGATTVDGYFPEGDWYDLWTLKYSFSGPSTFSIPTPLSSINVHVKGGSIIPMQDPALTTRDARKTNFTLLVFLSSTDTAHGDLYWDDGESLDNSKHSYTKFVCSDNMLQSVVESNGYSFPGFKTIKIVGVENMPTDVDIEGFASDSSTDWYYDGNTETLEINVNGLPLGGWKILWVYQEHTDSNNKNLTLIILFSIAILLCVGGSGGLAFAYREKIQIALSKTYQKVNVGLSNDEETQEFNEQEEDDDILDNSDDEF
eukprot:TRINITY_DN1751_c0_g3_i1.p1 TRINITY_DN1751_c0_g3~~TRINITY_DN1751_c0_g3_i1.p1  ORF type:complete len:967 (-),score=192.43 TRINITY_DN1751_c0_g3_i1:131-3031(-)